MATAPEMRPAEEGIPLAVDNTTQPAPEEPSVERGGTETQESPATESLSHSSPNPPKANADAERKPSSDLAASEERKANGNDEARDEQNEQNEKQKESADTSKDSAKDQTITKDAASPPPLPDEPLPDEQEDDDGWDPMWSDEHQAWYFFNRFTQQTQWDNPRVPEAAAAAAMPAVAGGYNPAIHGDYDPNAWYAKGDATAGPDTINAGGLPVGEDDGDMGSEEAIAAAAAAGAAAILNAEATKLRGGRGRPGADDFRSSKSAKAERQLNSFFDVEAAGTAHDGRSLKAERSGKKPSRSELKAFKEKRRVKKEEKRRAWLRD